jgi:Tol biopolymer transport system component
VQPSDASNDIWVLALFGDRKRYMYFSSAFSEIDPTLSPDGRWLAYVSNETNRREVYVRSFPTPGGKWTISKDGGTAPVWSRDGKELFFLGADSKLMAVEIRSGAKFEAGAPKTLFHTRMPSIGMRFDVSKDGRFLLPALPDRASSPPRFR